MDVVHTAIRVSDLDAATTFYIDELGLEHSRDFVGPDGVTNYYVRGGGETELQFKHDPEDDAPVEPSGFDHTAVTVDDVEATVEHVVEETNGSLRQGPTTVETDDGTALVAFVEDPDGYGVELIEA